MNINGFWFMSILRNILWFWSSISSWFMHDFELLLNLFKKQIKTFLLNMHLFFHFFEVFLQLNLHLFFHLFEIFLQHMHLIFSFLMKFFNLFVQLNEFLLLMMYSIILYIDTFFVLNFINYNVFSLISQRFNRFNDWSMNLLILSFDNIFKFTNDSFPILWILLMRQSLRINDVTVLIVNFSSENLHFNEVYYLLHF